MRILYIDIDCQRPDHLGCYGYHRPVSPNMDAIAAEGAILDAVYVSDAPCLPSRTALFSGRFGIHTGVIGHGGTAADMFIEGPERGFGSLLGRTSWMRCLRNAGLYTASVSPFAERHAAWHWYAGFREVINTGRRGLESAHEITPPTLDWLDRHGAEDDWFLHYNLWDPHTPYRTPDSFGNPFKGAPTPAWLTEEIRKAHWEGCGPHSAQEAVGYAEVSEEYKRLYPNQPYVIDSFDQVRRMFDGYDCGVLYADQHVGQVVARLKALGVYDETAILISADHGENLGELNVYGDHQTADELTCRVPLILRWPGVTDSMAGQHQRALHYQFDVAATIIELAGGTVPDCWHGHSFADSLRANEDLGRDELVLSQGAWSCQRSLRFRDSERDLLCIRSYHDGHHAFPDTMLFDVGIDPHEQHDIGTDEPALMNLALARIDHWTGTMMKTAATPVDPMWTVLNEGGPKHTKDELPAYLERLRATGRGHWADVLESRYS
jgi:arylsulfatase A-like enzyme